ncbi:hypothetical protein [Pseudoalteromonas aurantia]|uniref:hypothetical protein n=1 Tax=Pseudoalteromonas aurantia TaxID=43654 RepID=UPI001CE449BC|nr:hypothetical protein [Pseudoalteromonas aurantia]
MKISIPEFFEQSVDKARQMEAQNYRSFHGVLGNAQKKQQTVAKITSESFLQEYQEKAINFLKSQEPKLVNTQA